MLRGEFIRGDGLTIPNNITTWGAERMLAMALRAEAQDLWVGLCSGVYTPGLQIEDMLEPTIGVNGYGRKQVLRNNLATGWLTSGVVNDEPFLETDWMIWVAAGGPFSESIGRMFISATELTVTGDVFCLSAALPSEIVIDVDTLEADRKFKYRIYLR